MPKLDVLTQIESDDWQTFLKKEKDIILKCRDALLVVVGSQVPFLNENKNFYINLALSDDDNIHKLNKEFRGKDSPTNVLSFALIDDPDFADVLETQKDIELGDVMIAYETLKREAFALEIPFADHFCHLWVHGMLHILGYDHIKESDRIKMEQKEIEILARLGIENPYEE